MADYDLAIIGGGINGTGIARDAAGRGLRVLLVEMNDLGSGTSSASTKLIHGGLRYLEHGAFRLVREALTEREVLLRMAPHVIRPLRLVAAGAAGRALAADAAARAVALRLAGRAPAAAERSRTVDLTHHRLGQPLKRSFRYGFEYLRLLGRRRAAGRAQRARCRRARRRHPHPHQLTRAERGDELEAGAQQPRPPRDRDARACWSMPPAPGSATWPRRSFASRWRRGARLLKGSHIVVRAPLRARRAATFCRPPTAAWCSRCRSPAISR